jgi:hypothetical protein
MSVTTLVMKSSSKIGRHSRHERILELLGQSASLASILAARILEQFSQLQERKCAPSSHFRGVQPRRAAPGLRRRRQDDQAVGHQRSGRKVNLSKLFKKGG